MQNYLILFVLLLAKNSFSQDTVKVYFFYGSKPLTTDEYKWFGGKLGGHVGLGITKDSIYHFNPGGDVGAFGKKNEPGTWALCGDEQFMCTFGCDSNKTLVISIPIDSVSKAKIIEQGDQFLAQSPYPYAFFGMRCTAACYDLLSAGGITKKKSKTSMIFKNFYPRKLRKRLIRRAEKEGWKLEFTQGRITRKWDHD